jgi:hypothetical protein
MAAVVVLGLGGTVGGLTLGNLARKLAGNRPADPRLHDASFVRLEKELGRTLYAPTWLPDGMTPVKDLAQRGRYRVLLNYSDPSTERWLIMGQEPRSPERDAYHQHRLLPTADVEADVGGARGYFMRGTSGDRRLVWNTADSWLLLSSFQLSDFDLLRVARSVRSAPGTAPPGGPARSAAASLPPARPESAPPAVPGQGDPGD